MPVEEFGAVATPHLFFGQENYIISLGDWTCLKIVVKGA